mmetsp:Transcript_38529/g.91101  ORF Transcript_38529/g.91101 Transcript_38529/m.91101 type:complete len:213 (+) Transcript_38529:313-951(+)
MSASTMSGKSPAYRTSLPSLSSVSGAATAPPCILANAARFLRTSSSSASLVNFDHTALSADLAAVSGLFLPLSEASFTSSIASLNPCSSESSSARRPPGVTSSHASRQTSPKVTRFAPLRPMRSESEARCGARAEHTAEDPSGARSAGPPNDGAKPSARVLGEELVSIPGTRESDAKGGAAPAAVAAPAKASATRRLAPVNPISWVGTRALV